MARYVKLSVPKTFTFRDKEYYQGLAESGRGMKFHSVNKLVWWMDNEEKRDFLAEVIAAGRRALTKKPVLSNQELIDRIDEYLAIIQGRRVPPTIEEFSLYLGFTSATVMQMRDGINLGFRDLPLGPEMTTSKILERALDMLHQVDAIQSMKRMSDNTTYIFRSKNYYNMRDSRETAINVNINTPDALPPEQIARLLPELAPDRSMDGVTITDDDDDICS